jgi:hypothetical protein
MKPFLPVTCRRWSARRLCCIARCWWHCLFHFHIAMTSITLDWVSYSCWTCDICRMTDTRKTSA